MNYSYAICIPRENKTVYNWTMPLEQIDSLFVTKSREDVLAWLKQNDSVLEEEDANKLQIMKKVANNKYVSERYTYIIDNKNFLNFDITPFLLQNPKLVHKLHNILLPFQKRNVSYVLKKMIPLLEENVALFCQTFPYLPYEEKRIIRTALSEEEVVAKLLNKEVETLVMPRMKLERKAV